MLARRPGARMVRTRVEVQEQTEVGDALVRGLMRAQLGLAVRLAVTLAVLVAAIPLLGIVFPELVDTEVLGVRVSWLVLGIVLYPVFYLSGRLFVRLSEQAERDFVGVVDDDAGAP
ncbi:hypothetical protein GCM10009624_26740 [Gordonia sinesedis]